MTHPKTREALRLDQSASREVDWKRWGPYLSERQWGTVREDYSEKGTVWEYFPHDQARSRAYRWGEDGLLGICDRQGRLCFALALWNERDAILKERLFGLTGKEGNHGEDVKECYFYVDSTPTHSYMKALYKYPQARFPYEQLLDENRSRSRNDPEFELIDTGIFDDNRYFDVAIEYAKASANDMLITIEVANRGPDAARVHVLPTLWFRNTWSWGRTGEGYWPKIRAGDNIESIYWLYNRTAPADAGWLLPLAKKIFDNMARWDSGVINWHNVNIAQGFREPTVFSVQAPDPRLGHGAERNYQTVMGLYGQFPGGGFAGDRFAGDVSLSHQGGAFADAFAQISQFGPAHVSLSLDFDFFHPGRVQRENAFHALAVTDSSNGEGGVEAAPAPANHNSGKHLDALFVPFDDFGVDAHRVANVEVCRFLAELLLLNFVQQCLVHKSFVKRET